MSGTFLRLIPGVLTIAIGTVLAITQTGTAITTDLSARAQSALDPSAKSWANISVDGRTLVLSGTATEKSAIAAAVAALSAVPGSAGVDSQVALAEPISPYPFSVTVDGKSVALAGGYPSESLKAEWLKVLPGATDTLVLHSGAPSGFDSLSSFAVSAATLLDSGSVSLSDSVLTLSGRARDAKSLEALQSLTVRAPSEMTVAAIDIVPPVASPYVWSAKFDGRIVTISGDAPDTHLAELLRAVIPAGVDADIQLVPASGEPAGFADKALALLKSLLTLESGEASLNDAAATLTGAPGSASVADAATAVVAGLGGTATLEPPRVDSYNFAVAKGGNALTFSGFVPDAAERDALKALPGADVGKLSLARGAPDGFANVTQTALDLLGHLRAGSFALDGSKIAVSGQASSRDDFAAATAILDKPLPDGMSFSRTDIHPPTVSPFTFAATKSADGSFAFTGYVPTDAVRQALVAKAGKSVADSTQPADGAPDNFSSSAEKGLEILALLDTGTLRFDGANWAIEGSVDSARKGMAADAAYSIAGLRTAGWSYQVKLPALPIIAPYVFRAQKSTAGAFTFSGYVPDDDAKDSLKALAPSGQDTTVLGAGAPADFSAAATAGLAALAALDQGTLALTGDRWTLAGEIADTAQRDAIQLALTARISPANWQIAIQARDAVAVVTPYLWSATRTSDGLTDLSGYVPSEALAASLAASVTPLGSNSLSIASGAPAGFAEDAAAGLAALSHLSSGRAAFDGRSWSLVGGVATEADGDAAVAALAAGSAGGKLWAVTLDGYAPAAASSASSSASEPVVSASASSAQEPVSSAASEPSSTELDPSQDSSAASEPSSAESSSSAAADSSLVAPDISSLPPPSSSSALPSASASAPSSAPEPATPSVPTAIEVTTPLPDKLVFAARKISSGGIVLSGAAPSKDAAAQLGAAASASGAKLAANDKLPADFLPQALAGLTALSGLEDGQLGFDGTRWWLHGRVAADAAKSDAEAKVTALPQGSTWSVEIKVLGAFDICRLRAEAVSQRNDIAFKAGKRDLSPDSLAVLDELAKDFAICPTAVIHVQAHTDGDGDAAANLGLSVARAEMVVAELAKRGIAEDRLYAEGYGESDPVAPDDTKNNKAKNRRVVFVITEN